MSAHAGRPTSLPGGGRALAAALTLVLLAVALTPLSTSAHAEGVTWQAPVAQRDNVDPGLNRSSHAVTSVIVQALTGHLGRARDAVLSLGGTILTELPLVEGFEAEIPGTALDALGSEPSVRSVTANTTVTFEEYSYDETTTASSFARTSGATTAWSKGNLGQGVGVAVIDTGVSAMPDFAGRLVHGPDLSGEGTTIDSYGHGTVMAGVLGGSGADSAARAGGAFTGVAPRSTIVAVKTAGRNGVVDVSTILQAMHWVAAHKTQFNIRVMNLSWGTQSSQHHSLDPLNYAVQRLWRSGIVVVVAAGNSGPKSGTVTKPGDDPMVLTVGSYDDKQNLDSADDSLSSWSSRGPTAAGLRKPDVVAPGRSLIAARSYGSEVEVNHPKALVPPSYIKGSGTSQAAAVVSGLAALMISADPSLTPDQVKDLLTRTADPLPSAAAEAQGFGRVQLAAAMSATPGLPTTQVTTATGLGSIEQSRGGWNVETDCHADGVLDIIQGEIDVRCEPWEPALWTASEWDATAWMTDPWELTGWAPALWDGRAWTGGKWTGRAWTGRAWTGRAWTDSSWTGRAWTDASWTTSAWTTGGYGAWTTAEYEEFLAAWWGGEPPEQFAALGEPNDESLIPASAQGAARLDGLPVPAATPPLVTAPALPPAPLAPGVPNAAADPPTRRAPSPLAEQLAR